MVSSAHPSARRIRLADPGLRRAVEAAVRKRVRGDEADDVVQATYADVLAARELPGDEEELRRFVFGVARNKVFDHFRRQRRAPEELSEAELSGGEQPLSARDMLRWAETELPDSESRDTLQWMLREGDGEKLEHIARDARLPAPRVRQRVSRLRRLLRERWAAELMLAGLLLALLFFGAFAYYAGGRAPRDVVKGEPPRPVPSVPRAPAPLPRSEPNVPAGELPPAPSGSARAVKPLPPSSAKKLTPVPTIAPNVAPATSDGLAPTPSSPKQNRSPRKASSLDLDSWK